MAAVSSYVYDRATEVQMKKDSYKDSCTDLSFWAYLVSAFMPLGLLVLSSWDFRWPGECAGKYRYKTLMSAVTEVADW